MDRLNRTRSQHFVSSPRKSAIPLITRHTLPRHPTKRRRLAGSALGLASHSNDSDSSSLTEDDMESHRGRAGLSNTRLGRSTRSKSRRLPVQNGKGKGRERADTSGKEDGDVDEGDAYSPKKRKRSRRGSLSPEGSWVETSGDEGEPEFIAEGDNYLLQSAPGPTLHRLRKAELIRLWKVAGMWENDAGPDGAMDEDDEDDAGMGKKDLVDGILGSRKPSSKGRLISPLPHSPGRAIRRRSTLEMIQEPPASSPTSSDHISPGSTPKPLPRTRSRVRLAEPAVYTTESPSSSHVTPRRTLQQRPTRSDLRAKRVRAQLATRKTNGSAVNSEDSELTELSSDGGEVEGDVQATPLVKRLRPRGGERTNMREPSTDVTDFEDEVDNTADEADAEATEAEPDDLPVRGRRIKASQSNKSLWEDEDVAMKVPSSRKSGKSMPTRGAKKKAIEAIKGGERDTDDGMEVDADVDMDEDEESSKSAPVTPPRRNTRTSVDDVSMNGDDDEVEDQDQTPNVTPGQIHMTRSGKAFGMMQNRRQLLREEARDDPDMDEVEEESDDDDDDELEPAKDVDLSQATAASLVRLLRDELVQMCEARGIEVGGTKPQLAKALLEWRDEQQGAPSSTSTARPSPPRTALPRRKSTKSRFTTRTKSKSSKLLPAIATAVQVPGKPTPVLMREHVHAHDPETPPLSKGHEGDVEEEKKGTEAELNLDLQELGLEDSVIKASLLTKLEKIGSGGFKDVYVGKYRGRKVAISEFREHLSEMDIRELKLLAEFSHPNIVRFRGICIPEDSTQVPCMLVSELCENGDLFDYIRNVPRPSLKRVITLMLDIARGLEYLHTRKPSIIHRDCKSSNILINRAGTAKVGDFGLARVKNSTRSMIRSLVGTVNWQAPELWHPTPRYDYKVDVFSAAMVYWEMMSGWIGDKKYPWEGHNEHYIYDAVGNKQKRPSVAGLRKAWGNEPVNLMERMWHQDAGERPTMTDVVHDLEGILAEVK
ncbi:TKL protein kinase [Cryptococcus wingfieldii CBS 7118]|uniref:TKL protein kinase n=1 Tax=Cryptococcus wingfieldii CBS 7118 TaxID=1295528 RepID=A0A1E3IS68_9TREE|nr:TKL protein kinase [Cryptococcus wingfieldii CBS 7118]ODN91457.1 TKL protein kinase [Cryptococcus wingfieldii CBS 7118]